MCLVGLSVDIQPHHRRPPAITQRLSHIGIGKCSGGVSLGCPVVTKGAEQSAPAEVLRLARERRVPVEVGQPLRSHHAVRIAPDLVYDLLQFASFSVSRSCGSSRSGHCSRSGGSVRSGKSAGCTPATGGGTYRFTGCLGISGIVSAAHAVVESAGG